MQLATQRIGPIMTLEKPTSRGTTGTGSGINGEK